MAMYMITRFCFLFLIAASYSCESPQNASAAKDREMFPEELVSFVPSEYNPVFSAGPADAWDKKIRERGFILYEDSVYKLWYTGFSSDDDNGTKYLGYATSPDGIRWKRFEGNPVFSEKWTEDMFVFRDSGKYYMYAEGVNDVAHYLVSDDGIKWEEKGDLIILKTNGDTIPGPYGTPVVYVQNGKWYLFYHDSVFSEDKTHLRTVKVTELKYRPDGTIEPINAYHQQTEAQLTKEGKLVRESPISDFQPPGIHQMISKQKKGSKQPSFFYPECAY